jgi:mRNA-degrading endonuclease toxin of MazEF toxin-antitoxin module
MNFINNSTILVSQIHLVELGNKDQLGFLTAGKRPCLIYKCLDQFKYVVMPFTTQKLDKERYFEYRVKAGFNGLKADSKLLIDQLRIISVHQILSENPLGMLSDEDLKVVQILFKNLMA